MFKKSDFLRNHRPFLIFYVLFLLVGFLTFKDYGISWDEPACRIDIGITNHNFIFKGDYNSLLYSNAKYHGPSFEIILYEVERLFNIEDSRNIYLMRHMLTFLLFAVAVLFFYKLCRRYFKNEWIAILGSMFLVISPRIYADAFYNTKDLAFLSMLILSAYTTMVFLERKNFKTGLIHAAVTAFMIDIRIIGIIVPVFTWAALLIDIVKEKENREKWINQFFYFSFFVFLFIVAFWPVLWRHSMEHFYLAIKENSKFPWGGWVYFKGVGVKATDLKWDYIPLWMVISTPILYLILFGYSLLLIAIRLIKRFQIDKYIVLNCLLIFAPILSVIILHSVVYDGWRHLYFIYPSIIFLSLIGLDSLISGLKKVNREKFGYSCIALYLGYLVFCMILLHPYEHLYFNFIGGKNLAEARKNYELDYWGLSYYKGLQMLLKNDTSKTLYVSGQEYYPLFNNIQFLPLADRNRFIITDFDLSYYYLANFRNNIGQVPYFSFLNLIRDDAKVLSVYRIGAENLSEPSDKDKIVELHNNYDSNITGVWTKSDAVISDPDSPNNKIERMDTKAVFSCNVFFKFNEEQIKSGNKKFMKVDFQVKSKEPYDGAFVFQVDSGEGKTYVWNQYQFNSSIKNQWNTHHVSVFLPIVVSSKDMIKMYVCNVSRKDFLLDNIDIKIFEYHN